MELRITASAQTWPIAGSFVISRGAKTEAHVVVATVTDGVATGRGEAVPYARYGETITGALAAIGALPGIATRRDLAEALPAGAARNAVDCALWDFEAKRAGLPVHRLAGRAAPAAVTTCYTLSLDTPEAMADKARSVPHLPLLKLKLGGPEDEARMKAVRRARPDARLVADANEGWNEGTVGQLLSVAADQRFELIEQPLPADGDQILAGIARPVPVCADESAHTSDDLCRLLDRYDAINIKLDKTGGLTGALDLADAARAAGLKVMVGCMVATSLSMAPAVLVAQSADWADLDGPLLLARDREHGLSIENGVVQPPSPALWG